MIGVNAHVRRSDTTLGGDAEVHFRLHRYLLLLRDTTLNDFLQINHEGIEQGRRRITDNRGQ